PAASPGAAATCSCSGPAAAARGGSRSAGSWSNRAAPAARASTFPASAAGRTSGSRRPAGRTPLSLLPEPDGNPYRRAAFLALVAGGLSSLAWASPALRLLDSVLPGGAQALLPSQGWRIYTIGDSMPRFDPRSWRLRIDGLVTKPRELGYDELLRLPRAEQTSDF